MSFTISLLIIGGFIFSVLLAFSLGIQRERRRAEKFYHSDQELQRVAKESYVRGYKDGERAMTGRSEGVMKTFQVITKEGLVRNIDAEVVETTEHSVEFDAGEGRLIIFRRDVVLRVEPCIDFM